MEPNTSKHTSFITTLPNEVLRTILSFLPYRDFRDMLALRAVSRQFYLAVYETDFWYRDELDFSRYDHDLPEHNRATVLRRQYERVLADKHLVRVLGHQRKSGWTFHSIQPFLVVIERIPQFYQNARRIHLCEIDHGLGIVIDKLASCQLITKLAIEFSYETIDLDTIAKSCPYLEDLEVHGLDDYRGTLRHNKNLRRLSIRFVDYVSTQKLTTALIPFDSARMLTSLVIVDCYAIDSDVEQPLLDSFRNLKHLFLDPLLCETEDFCNVMIDADIKLTELEIIVFPDFETLPKMLSTFSAKCLQYLEKLTVKMDTEEYEPSPDPIVNAITSQLLSLKEIELVMPLEIHWCEKFARLTNLKFLRYVIPANRLEDHIYVGQEELQLADAKKEIEKAFEKTFESFVEKPRVEIKHDPCPF